MAINKVDYNGRTLIDLTEDTVTSETLLSGQTAHDRSGQAIAGSLSLDPIQSGLAIIVNGDTASISVPVGGCAYIKNNTHGLSEGLYKNTSSAAFPASGGTADGTVFTPASGGLGSEVALLNSNLIKTKTYTQAQMTWNRNDHYFYMANPLSQGEILVGAFAYGGNGVYALVSFINNSFRVQTMVNGNVITSDVDNMCTFVILYR